MKQVISLLPLLQSTKQLLDSKHIVTLLVRNQGKMEGKKLKTCRTYSFYYTKFSLSILCGHDAAMYTWDIISSSSL